MRIGLLLIISFVFAFCSPKDKKVERIIANSVQKADLSNISDIPLPSGFVRKKIDSLSFEYFLRNFPLSENNTVFYYNGDKKYNQNNHYAVLDIDIGTRDLQQCADAVMRLRGEYLYTTKQYSKIHFNFLSDGKPRYYKTYSGNDRSKKTFRKYMDYIFSYANTSSLFDEMKKVEITDMQIGDVFIQKGRPYGHAIIVVDMAENIKTGKKIFLIAQSFMPAQSIHILKNFNDSRINPWYSLNFGENLFTPDWTFTKDDLRRFN